MTTKPDAEYAKQGKLNPERWRQIDALFAAALERGPAERSGFLDAECGGDPDLRRSVEELLDNDAEAGNFLESPAFGGRRRRR